MRPSQWGFAKSLLITHVLAGVVIFVVFVTGYLLNGDLLNLALGVGGLAASVFAATELRREPLVPVRMVWAGSVLATVLIVAAPNQMGLAVGAVFLFYAATGVILIDSPRRLTVLLVLLTLASISDALRAIADIIAAPGPFHPSQVTQAVSLSAAAILEAVVFVVAAVVFRQLRGVVLRRDEVIRTKDELIDTISHELRTPLTAVVGYTQLLLDPQRDDIPESLRQELQLIEDGTRTMEDVIDDFTVAARSGSGGISPRLAPVSLRAELDQVFRSLPSNQHNITVSVGAERAFADARYLRQIMRNLITNALQHGGERVEITASETDEQVNLSIWDNGPGTDLRDTTKPQRPRPVGIQRHRAEDGRKPDLPPRKRRDHVPAPAPRRAVVVFGQYRDSAIRVQSRAASCLGIGSSPGPISDEVRPQRSVVASLRT